MNQSKDSFDPFIADWKAFASNEKFNLVEKCLKLAQILEYPELIIPEYIKKINQIGQSLKLSIENKDNPTYRISMLNEHLFQNLGFRGDVEDYYNPKNNFLNDVLDKKSGIPITLSIIYSEVAKHIGLDLKIVGFPSHVVVKYGEELILDPFNEGKLLTIEDLEGILEQNFQDQLEFSPSFLNEIEPTKVLIRLARNLKNSYAQSYSYENSLRCVNMILSMEPNSPEEIRDKGILEDRFLHHDSALKFLNQYLELEPNAEDVDFILDLIKSIREKINR